MNTYQIYWGEAHDNVYATDPMLAPMDEMLRRAASHLDFYAAACYTAWLPTFSQSGQSPAGDEPHPLILEEWKSQKYPFTINSRDIQGPAYR